MIVINYLYGCPYCKNAEKTLKMYNIPYTKNIVTTKTKENFKQKYRMDTFPQIFYRGSKLNKIGGFTELLELIKLCKIINRYNFNPQCINNIKKFIN